MSLRILVVSNVGLVRDALSAVLARQQEVDVLGCFDLFQAKERISRLRPEVILFDAGRQGSVEFVKEIVTLAPHSKVVAFGVRETEADILALAAAGTAGYIRDNVKSGDIVKVLQQLLSDELTCSPRATASLYRQVGALSQRGVGLLDAAAGLDAATTRPGVPLSRRELQIANLIDCGLTNKEIGRQLGIEAATVKNHIHNLCEKLNVHRRGEATARIRALLSDSALPPAVPDSLPAPRQPADQNPAARGNSHVGQPWVAIGQLDGIATASVPSDANTPLAKL
jgi:two-component system, NarL family, nitrate/nitrite response regulator NarL